MWTSIAFVAALSLAPGQAGELKLTNVRPTYGVLGAVRPTNEVMPGDVYFITFDIENLAADDEGKTLYSMGMELINPQGQTEYKKEPQDRPITLYNVLGGSRIPAFAHAQTGTETVPGDYTLKVTVIDRTSKKTATLSRAFKVLKKNFGLVELTTTYDKDGIFSAPAFGVAGQSLFVNFWTAGFERAKGQPNITYEMRVVDESGKPTLPKAIMGALNKDVPEDWQRLPMQFLLPLNRPGRFTVRLKANDLVSKKTTELTFPITVLELK